MAERRPLVISGNNVSELPQTDILPGVQTFHGWPFPYEVSLSYDKTARTVTITPSGSTFTIWVGGVAYVKTGAQTSTAHPDASDQHFLYYNTSGALEWSTTPWDMKVVSPVVEVYYDTIPADGIALNELHTFKRNAEWHESQHFAIGTFVRSGLEISGYTLNAEGNAAVTFQVAAGTIVDEDIEFAISTLSDGGPYTVVRRSGASGYTWDSANTVPYLSGATWIQYNQNNAGTWQMTEAGAANRWVNYYLYATTALDTAKRLFLIPGQSVFSTLATAQAESNASLNLTGLGLAEFVCVWKLTFATANGYTATGRVRLVEVNRITNTRGALSVNLTTTNHSLLTGRDTADSHPASAITNTPAGNISATTVQAAIDELDSEKAATGHTHAQLHDPVTVADSTSIDLTLTGQQISAAAIFGTTSTTVAQGNHTHASLYQPLDADLTSIAGLTTTSGMLQKTAADTWTLLNTLPDFSLQSVAASLHRSPNAITALFVYDTSKDSDPTWVDRCQHTSWYNETIYGKWLGAQASEAAARAVSGATTDDYYQLTTDGKFYKLNATTGVTEVFRGNKRAFPKLAAIVAEATSVTIYDLTEPGRPMFCRFIATANATITSKYLLSGANALAAINGKIYVGGTATNATGLTTIDFAKDMARLRLTSGYTWNGNLSTRNTVGGYTTVDASVSALVNATANAVATTILPDAPLDPATGLKVPTIAVATGVGLSLIQHSGTVRNSSSTLAFTQVTLTPQLLSAGRADAVWYYAANPGSLGASFALTTKNASTATDFNVGNTTLLKAKDRANYVRTSGAVVQLLRNNEGTIGKGIAAKLSDTYNTGWLAGDIRRAYLASNVAGSVGPVTELVTNGTFDTDTTGWEAAFVSQGSSISAVGGKLAIVGRGAKTSLGTVVIPGKTYKFTFYQEPATPYLNAYCAVGIGYSENGADILNSGVFRYSSWPANTYNFYVTIPASYAGQTVVVTFNVINATGDLSAYTTNIDNVSFTEVISDRSYKAAGANINGTLTAAAVNTNNDLVAYSGFSAANYIREAYSADLDFSTNEWSASAWVTIPTANAAAGTAASRAFSSGPYITLGIDATNKLTATAYDGTTTRTVTTTAAYNTATWIKARANYTTDGKLAILVNGVEVASATGTPLLTLNNPDAVLTIGNSYALDAPFPGSIALLKFSATVPTAEQSLFMYEQEKHLFTAGAKCVLPASTNVLDLAYDDATDTWSTLQATHESTFSGLVRTATQTPSAGSFSKSTASSGVKLLGRTTTNPGVDVQMPVKNLRPKDMPKDSNQDIVVFDFDAVTSQTDFVLPTGYTARVVYSAGAQKRLGSTKDYILVSDGFRETVRFGTAPGNGVWVQVHAVKEVSL